MSKNLLTKLINKKFINFFKTINQVYCTPKSTKNLVNKIIANKIALQFNAKNTYIFKEREQISYELSHINFTSFLKYSETSEYTDIVFMINHPNKIIKVSNNISTDKFIYYVLKKYYNELDSQKLYDIYKNDISESLLPIEEKLKNIILEIVTHRSLFINRVASLFESKKNKQEIKDAVILKKIINSTKYKIIPYQDKKSDNNISLENITKSAF